MMSVLVLSKFSIPFVNRVAVANVLVEGFQVNVPPALMVNALPEAKAITPLFVIVPATVSDCDIVSVLLLLIVRMPPVSTLTPAIEAFAATVTVLPEGITTLSAAAGTPDGDQVAAVAQLPVAAAVLVAL